MDAKAKIQGKFIGVVTPPSQPGPGGPIGSGSAAELGKEDFYFSITHFPNSTAAEWGWSVWKGEDQVAGGQHQDRASCLLEVATICLHLARKNAEGQ